MFKLRRLTATPWGCLRESWLSRDMWQEAEIESGQHLDTLPAGDEEVSQGQTGGRGSGPQGAPRTARLHWEWRSGELEKTTGPGQRGRRQPGSQRPASSRDALERKPWTPAQQPLGGHTQRDDRCPWVWPHRNLVDLPGSSFVGRGDQTRGKANGRGGSRPRPERP